MNESNNLDFMFVPLLVMIKSFSRALPLIVLMGVSIQGFTQTANDTARIALEGMISTFLELNGISIKQASKERIRDEFKLSVAEARIQFKPKKKIYIKSFDTEGELKSEVLYKAGENDGDALVNPVSFPYINLDLDPRGSLMRKNHHHTILEAGGQYLANVIQQSMKMADTTRTNEFEKRFLYKGLVEENGRKCYHIEIFNSDFEFIPYTVKANENVVDIARDRLVPEYMILENNRSIDDYNDVREGQVIQVPKYYGKRITLYIGMNTFIPWYQRIEDHKGLFAEYRTEYCYLNPEFNTETFSEDNEAYGF